MPSLVKLLIISVIFLIKYVASQDVLEACESYLEMPKRNAHVHCSCMQTLIDIRNPLIKLTINQTGCEDRHLVLDWNALQTYVGVETLIFDSAMIRFGNATSMMDNSSVTEVIFINSKIGVIQKEAFNGLHLLEKIRFINTQIGDIKSKSFFTFPRLKTIEFSDSTVGKLESGSFGDIPQLFEIGFIRTHIDIIESNALMLSRPPIETCARSLTPTMNEFMARDLLSTANLTLPNYGPRIFVFKSNITKLESRSIVADSFSYIIFAGNYIENLQTRAFEAELKNRCDISALLVIGNTIKRAGSEFFSGVTGSKDPDNLATYLELSRNTFDKVSSKAFIINETLQVYSVEQNRIGCTCENFHWVLSNDQSETQKDLERQLVEDSLCLDESPLQVYLVSYEENCPPPRIFPNEDRLMAPEDPNVGSAASSFSHFVGLSIIFYLIQIALLEA